MIDNQGQQTLAIRLAEKLRTRIQSESHQDGDLFMTEAQLAAEYKVSRPIVREAVSRLNALGILEGRQRKGLVVRCPSPVGLLSASLPLMTRSPENITELARLRYVLEVGAVELAVQSAIEEQIEQLDDIAVELERATRSGNSETREKELDLQFHTLLLEMTGSTLVAGMQHVLAEFFASQTGAEQIEERANDRVIWEHRELVSAVRDRDVERARYMIRSHLRGYLSFEAGGEAVGDDVERT